jgi:hypothetical protein
MIDRSHDATPTEPVLLAPAVAEPERAFNHLVRADNGEPHPFLADQVYETLLHPGPDLTAGDHAGYGRVVAAAYRAVGKR